MAAMDPAAGADPAMADPSAPAPVNDPGAMPDAGADPMAGDEGEMPMSDQEESSDSTVDIINQLSPSDREAVRAYAESMLSRDETNMAPEAGQEEAPAPEDQGVMMEITKKRLTKVQKRLNEMFADNLLNQEKDETDREQKKIVKRKGNFKSPFDSPLD